MSAGAGQLHQPPHQNYPHGPCLGQLNRRRILLRNVAPRRRFMPQTTSVSLRHCFTDLKDFRREHCRLHTLWDIIALTICAVVSGADSWVDVEQYGHDKLPWLQTFLELAN